jgi:hypothetical protein
LIRARLAVGNATILDVDAGVMTLERVEGGAQELELYQVANQVAAEYFGGQGTNWISSDPSVLNPAEFELVGSKGSAEEFRRPGQETRDQFWVIESSESNLASKLKQYMELAGGHINEALARELLEAERTERDSVEAHVSACLVPRYYDIYKSCPELKELNRFLIGVLEYFRALRPKPEYRRDIDFDAVRRRLKRQWRLLKLRIALASWFRR